MVNVVAVIVVAALFAVAFCVMIPVGIFRSGSSPTQQLRWVFCLWIYAISAIGLGAVALNQPYVSRPDDDRAGGVKLVGWGPDVTVAFTLPFVAAIVSTSIFQSLGARTILPVLTLLTYGSLAMGIFLQDFGMWFWFMSAMIFYVFQWAAIFLSDRLDAVTNFVQGRGGRRMAEMPEWNGLLWRFLFILGQIPYFVYWALNFDTTQVFTSFLGPLILIAIVHFVFAGVGSFLCYWFGPPREGTDASLLVRSSIDGGGKAPLNGARSAYQ